LAKKLQFEPILLQQVPPITANSALANINLGSYAFPHTHNFLPIGITHNYREFGTTGLETALTILHHLNDTAMF
jgi:hypothetical protein